MSGRGLVVVLDDDHVFGELLAVMLEQAGFEPLAVADGEQACALVAERAAEVVAAVCDLQLGCGPLGDATTGFSRAIASNGAEVLRTLRTLAPGLTAVVMSGHPADHVRDELAKLGTDAIVLEKPFRPTELVDLLRRPAELG